ncbi:sugar phosphate isomerase/epimerase [Domibacillus indicus]|uniref:sugar phosphate isomerase/epimerase family protein n=1 Tax=Domibacillus indicus TaxID=1437523 RepID=UPI00203F1F76|nr:sugar phosphate isomerase/epimerase [Domibacillus indicus]MCM3791332.1 sugar phosphate isomerase/epimerase [Domibacillus indicus]
MKLGYNPTLIQAELEEELRYCEYYGFDAIELRIEKLKDYFTRNSMQDLKDFFARSSLKPLSLNAVEEILFADKETKRKNDEDLEFLFEVGRELNIQDIVIVPSFHETQYSLEEIKSESVKVLKDIAARAKKFDMRLAYEFIGNPSACVNNFKQCYEIVEAVNADNVGISLDFFHFYAMNSNIEDLRNADINKIFLVHINDADYYPPGSLREKEDRLFPGEGAIPIHNYLDILNGKNYQGLVSVELFRPEYDTWDVETFIRTVKEKTAPFLNSIMQSN